MSSREPGFQAIEWAVGLGLLVLPVAILVLTVATWGARTNMARLIAQESARRLVLADDWQSGSAEAEDLAAQIARSHGLDEIVCGGKRCMSVTITGSAGETLGRGSEVTVVVRVPIPAMAVPFLPGTLTETFYTATHVERVDDYRSLP